MQRTTIGPRTLLLGILWAAACAADPGIQPTDSTGGSSGGAAGGVSGGSSQPTPVPTGSGGATPSGTPSSGGASGSGAGGAGAGPTCSTTSAKAMPLPVDILILQDRSGSMKELAMPGSMSSKWEATQQAIAGFLRSADSAGFQVGLNFFPAGDGGEGGSCGVAAYAKPAVPIGTLPGVGAAIDQAIAGTMPRGGTPTLPALMGAVQYAQQWEQTKNRRVAIALATDGEPNDCNSTIQAVSRAASSAAAMGIYTFVIGVGPNLQNLNAIAAAGNTKMAYFADAASVDQLIAALKNVQLQAARLACSFGIPVPPNGATLDPSRVNVRFTPAGAPPVDLSQVGARRQCGPMGGWYYDDPAAPRTISLCDASCALVNSSPDGELSLLFGCQTTVIK